MALTLLITFLVAFPAIAQEQRTDQNVVLRSDEVINQDFFATGSNITLAGTVNGDAYVAGGTVIIEGTINGDLLVAGGTIDIRGRVVEDVRAVGGQINVSGDIGGNISTAGGSVNLTDAGNITGSLSNASGSLSVFAPVGRGATFSSGQAILGNRIGGDILASVGQLTLTPQAQVAGNLTYISSTQAQISPGAQISGQVTQRQPAPSSRFDPAKFFAEASLITALISFLSSLLIGLLFLYFLPSFTLGVAAKVRARPGFSLLVGFLAAILFPILLIILMVTVIGIPLALILLAVFLTFAYLAKIFVSIAIGQLVLKLFNTKSASYWALILGLVIYELLFLIPIFGWIIAFLIILLGFGAVLLTLQGYYRGLKTER